MTVIVLANCPPGLRGFLTRWLLEVSPGVFLGSPSARVRDILWDEVRQYRGKGVLCSPIRQTTSKASPSRPTNTRGTPPITRASSSSNAPHSP
ncbi:hypothetical protein GCM10023100_57010 [Actinocorallia cavernae]|uniref:Uncharacterized protein n=1 Tax=Actinocorallia cavernae TaxID=328075 RepID=A0ABP8T2D6_9ACTN